MFWVVVAFIASALLKSAITVSVVRWHDWGACSSRLVPSSWHVAEWRCCQETAASRQTSGSHHRGAPRTGRPVEGHHSRSHWPLGTNNLHKASSCRSRSFSAFPKVVLPATRVLTTFWKNIGTRCHVTVSFQRPLGS